MNAMVPTHASALVTPDDLARANFEVLRRSGRKQSTVGQYAQTEQQWAAFCQERGFNPARFEVVFVDQFFQSIKDQYSRVTLQNKLSHLRKAVEALGLASDDTAALYLRQLQALKAYKIDPEWGGTNTHKRAGKRISTAAVYGVINGTESEDELTRARNAAFYALLFFAGLRRSELRNLKWADVDLDRSVIRVVGGKRRDKTEVDEVPMLGDLKMYLAQWQVMQGERSEGRVYVICPIRKGGHIGPDKPIASGTVYELMAASDVIPHDARHTLITSLLEKHVPLHTVQKIARHRRADTTLRYAHALEAEQLATTTPNPYG